MQIERDEEVTDADELDLVAIRAALRDPGEQSLIGTCVRLCDALAGARAEKVGMQEAFERERQWRIEAEAEFGRMREDRDLFEAMVVRVRKYVESTTFVSKGGVIAAVLGEPEFSVRP